MPRRLPAAVGLFLFAAGAAFAAPPRALSFEERVAAERAVHDVYWRARSWPEGNVSAKPPLRAVMSDEDVRARVLDLLRKSNALATRYRRVPGSTVLGAELRRMAEGTRAPETLKAIFTALGDDPVLAAETLARRVVVERELRDAYAWDRELHAAVRARAQAGMSGMRTPADLTRLGAEYRERSLRLDGPSDREETKALVQGLQAAFGRGPGGSTAAIVSELPVGRASALAEDAESFRVVAILESGATMLRVATVTWKKTAFETWWRGAASEFAPTVATLDGPVDPVRPAAEHSCAVAPPWVPTPAWGVPSPRVLHTAVWTGAELIVWGGQDDVQSLGTGHRYDPATDTWTPVATLGAPEDRAAHTAVWTGSKMIVWGGTGGIVYADGGVYDPATDTWQPTTTIDAPPARAHHTAVWTGSKMIVWGGDGGAGSGASYDPVANAWTQVASSGAPSDRSRHVAAWTGTRMVVWGGRAAVGSPLDDGGVYDPSTDTWSATATSGAPSARWGHVGAWSGSSLWVWGGTPDGSAALGDGARYDPVGNAWTAVSDSGAPAARSDARAVWTGTQLVVWGGVSAASPLGDGARYDVGTESWLPIAAAGAPAARRLHSAVWTDQEMLVFGGLDARAARADGGRYDPAANVWTPMTGGVWAPSTRRNAVSVSTGAEFLVYGGENLNTMGPEWTVTGAVYDPAIDAWRPMAPPDPDQVLPRETAAVWTGTEMIVWGGREPSGGEEAGGRGGRYDPALDAWTPVGTVGAPPARSMHSAVWTGTAMIVWGGTEATVFDSGGSYDPATDTWAGIASGGIARYAHTAVWTGSRMIAWGGWGASGGLGGAAAIYDPAANLWSFSQDPLPGNDPPPTARINHSAVWTGLRMIVWGGQKPSSASVKYGDGAGYDPALDRWFTTATSGAPSARDMHTAVWTGSRMVVWAGTNSCCFLNTGGEYDTATNSWAPTFGSGAPSARAQHSAAALGDATILWGGLGVGSRTTNTGATYCACSFYGDQDADGYGDPASLLRDCAFVTPPPGYVRDNRDCDDTSGASNPGAADALCDGVDQNCSGGADEGYLPVATSCGLGPCVATGTTSCVGGTIADSCAPVPPSAELCDGIDNDCDGFIDNAPAGVSTLTAAKSGPAVQLAWTALLSAASYDVTRGAMETLRSSAGDFTPSVDACVASDLAANTVSDATAPPAGGFWYLVRGKNCAGAGSYDEGEASQSGSRDSEVATAPLACP
jgi:N-acetylneuraminic acid mutarotase